MRMPLSATLVRSFAELARLREAWDRLAMARRTPEVFHTFAWAEAWGVIAPPKNSPPYLRYLLALQDIAEFFHLSRGAARAQA